MGACERWLENVGQLVDERFWVEGEAHQCQYKVLIAVGIEHMSIGTFGLKADQHASSKHIPPWLLHLNTHQKVTLQRITVQE